MKKLISLLVATIICNITCFAQFSSSETVYCYQYDYTINDGIKSRASNETIIFVNFQNGIMGLIREDSIKTISKNLGEDHNYYINKTINKIATDYNDWKNRKPVLDGIMYNTQATGIHKYDPQISTSSSYTYRWYYKEAQIQWGNAYHPQPYVYWGKPQWSSECYTFSKDRSTLIIWDTNDPNNRYYYKLVDPDEFKPDLDFLYE